MLPLVHITLPTPLSMTQVVASVVDHASVAVPGGVAPWSIVAGEAENDVISGQAGHAICWPQLFSCMVPQIAAVHGLTGVQAQEPQSTGSPQLFVTMLH